MIQRDERHFAIEIAYDGGGFQGWQIQPGTRTVQEIIQNWASRILNQRTPLIIAGRTDSGVHAKATLATFHAVTGLSAARLFRGMQSVMPADIRVIRLHEFDDEEFNARFSARWRRYEYHIHCGLDPFLRDRAWCLESDLDHTAMAQALREFRGKQDCKAFCVAKSLPESAISYFHFARLEREGKMIKVILQADRFMHSQVRSIVGTLVAIGRGREPVELVKELLQNGRRELCGVKAPAQGLYLAAIGYPRFQTGAPVKGSHRDAHYVMPEGTIIKDGEALPERLTWQGPSHGTREQALELARTAAENETQKEQHNGKEES